MVNPMASVVIGNIVIMPHKHHDLYYSLLVNDLGYTHSNVEISYPYRDCLSFQRISGVMSATLRVLYSVSRPGRSNTSFLWKKAENCVHIVFHETPLYS